MDDEERQQVRSALQGEDARPLTALEAVAQTRRLVLLGDPGSGKSTFVRQVVARLAVGHLDPARHPVPVPAWQDAPPLPLLVTLRDLAPRLTALALDGMTRA
jgi:predicted NACHT family NTPase